MSKIHMAAVTVGLFNNVVADIYISVLCKILS